MTERAEITAAPVRRRTGRLLRRLALALAGALAVYVAVTAVRLALTYADVVGARGDLLAAEATLRDGGLDASETNLARARADALAARSRFASAEAFLEGEPLLRLAARLPWLGDQVDAAAALAGIGRDGSDIALAGVNVLESFDETADGDASPGARTVAFLAAARPEIDTVERRLDSVQARRQALGGALLPPLAEMASEVDRRLPAVEELVAKYRAGDEAAPALLGYEGPRTYLVLGQDNAELMPGGGILGVYGRVTLDRGRLTAKTFSDVEGAILRWQEASGGEYVEPPGPLKRYLLRDWTWNLSVANWSPHFPASAESALSFLARAGEPPVDGVIAMDFTALEGIIGVLGPQEIEGVTVTADNVTEETLSRTRGPSTADRTRHAFAMAVASRAIDGLLTAERESWGALLETLDILAAGKHLAVYTPDANEQARLRALGWTAEVLDAPGDYLQLVEASVHSTKLNLALDQSAALQVTLGAGGRAHHDLTVAYENRYDEWAEGRDPAFVREAMLSGFYGDYVRLLAPARARLGTVKIDGREVGAEEVGREAGKASFGRYLPLPRGESATLAFSYDVPWAARLRDGAYEYRLLIQKQPGSAAMPLSIDLVLPEGASARSLSLDGEPLDAGSPRIETTLDRDRELVVRYEARR